MKERIDYIAFRLKKTLWDLFQKTNIIKKRPLFDFGGIAHTFYKERILDVQQGNDYIYDALLKDSPALIARVGTIEMGVWNKCLGIRYHVIKKLSTSNKERLCNNAGFFPNEEKDDSFLRWADLYDNALAVVDGLAVFETHAEDYVVHKFCGDIKLMQLCSLEPYFFDNPWSKALENKRVLVIHPFVASIEKQYSIRDKIFPNSDVLPKFELLTIKAVQSAAGEKVEFDSWFEALNHMERQIDEVDFDIAILGCGAYALPLGAYIKNKGKKAVVMAGATQLLFGIMGSRWENNALMKKMVNSYWTRPDASEQPQNADKVEGACYW